MSATIGFALITHNQTEQAKRLVDRLNEMFDCPPIACHHDFSKSPLNVGAFPDNLSFVYPHIRTNWGEFSVVEATMRSLEQLYKNAKPDWFILLSGADYPIKPASQILSDLSNDSYDAYIEFERIDPADLKSDWQRDCYQRYYSKWYAIPQPIIRLLHLKRHMMHIIPPALMRQTVPFSDQFECFAGAHWFCGNRETAEFLIRSYASQSKLVAHYRQTKFPEESFFQTLILNNPNLKVSSNNWRYIDWSDGGAHPKTLQMEDLPKLQASTAHFARKFDLTQDARILDALDTEVLQGMLA